MSMDVSCYGLVARTRFCRRWKIRRTFVAKKFITDRLEVVRGLCSRCCVSCFMMFYVHSLSRGARCMCKNICLRETWSGKVMTCDDSKFCQCLSWEVIEKSLRPGLAGCRLPKFSTADRCLYLHTVRCVILGEFHNMAYMATTYEYSIV